MKSILTHITLIPFLLILFIPNCAFAETKIFIKEYTYQASEDDSRNSSRITAMREVKRLLLEELGTYLESITEVKNFQLTKDQITSLTAGIVKTEIIDEKWNGEKYWIRTKIVADENDVIKSIDNLRKDRDKSRELEETKKRADAILEENKKLRDELALAKGNAKQQVQKRYDKSIKELSAFEWLESGYKNHIQGDLKMAIADYTKAIELNPKFDLAYNNRGVTYHMLGKYNEALVEYNKAIELNPKYADAYNNRGMAYHVLGKYKEAFADYNKSTELNPQDASPYNSRGITYHILGKYNEALVEYNKSIELNPKYADAYNNRGMAYHVLGKYKEAFADYNKSTELNPRDASPYNSRGITYHILGKYNEALFEYNKSIEMNPQNAYAYKCRGMAYHALGKYNEERAEYNKANQLELK